MVFYKVCTKKAYKKKDGTEKVSWPEVGTLKKTDDDKYYLELNMFPGVAFYIFPPKAKEESEQFNG